MKIKKAEIINNLTVIVILFYGIYLAIVGGYGSDEDTLAIINSFETLFYGGYYSSSRFTGYPVAEIIIGYLSVFYGSYAANLLVFLSFFFSLFFIFFTFQNKGTKKLFSLFLLLSISNPILYFDNLEPIDYSLALLFFSIGTYFFSKKIFELSFLFFIITIGTRLNFALFIIFFIFFYRFENENLSLKKKLGAILLVIFCGCLFYTPIWFQNNLGFDWLTSARPTEEGLIGIIGRFLYKTLQSFGFISSFLILFIFYNFYLKDKINLKNNRFAIFFIILSNLLIFLYIPAEFSYLQLAIVLTYFITVHSKFIKLVYFLVILNFLTWFVNFEFVQKIYANNSNSICTGVHAIDYKLRFHTKDGHIKNFFKTRNSILCLINHSKGSERYKRISQGKKLFREK